MQLTRYQHRWPQPPGETRSAEREETTIFDTVAVVTALMVVVGLIGFLETMG